VFSGKFTYRSLLLFCFRRTGWPSRGILQKPERPTRTEFDCWSKQLSINLLHTTRVGCRKSTTPDRGPCHYGKRNGYTRSIGCSGLFRFFSIWQWAKSPKNSLKEKIAKKQSEGVRFLLIRRHVVKNTLFQTAFSTILPTGMAFIRCC